MPDPLATARLHIARAAEALKLAQAALDAAAKPPANGPANTPFTPPATACYHIRQHRLSRPPKLASDPELRAFVEARLDYMTFPAIAEAVAQAFPPDRRVGKSTIHKWYQSHRT